LNEQERRDALRYLFQANPIHLIGRYPRYQELLERYRGSGEIPEKAERFFQHRDYTDLQVLSQLAWFDEFFLQEPEIAALVRKGHDFSLEDQQFVVSHQTRLISRVLPEYKAAADAGVIEISTSPFYHPILPLLCDTNMGAASSPGLPLPRRRFCHSEDAREQLRRSLDLHEHVFGIRPRGVWPSEGSVSEEVLALAHELGIDWMASDEGVLGRTINFNFGRDSGGKFPPEGPDKLYTVYRYEKENARMHLLFRDHQLSDLIGFVYSGMKAGDAADHLMYSIRSSAQAVLDQGRDAVVPIILDGENAWEFYPESGREFLRRFYSALQEDPEIEAVTVSEAIVRQQELGRLASLIPGSWINANFNVWIGAVEDNRSWDYLSAARDFYTQAEASAQPAARELVWEELLIAEGSDWNWWYGPEHHSANDREFDELYRKHLGNVYQALGAAPPEYLAQPICAGVGRPVFVPQTAYIHPRIEGDLVRYFAWVGAAMYTADRHSGAMHGRQVLLDSVYAGIDEQNLYGRVDFAGTPPNDDYDLLVNIEATAGSQRARSFRLDVRTKDGEIASWQLAEAGRKAATASSQNADEAALALGKNFEFRLPLKWLVPITFPGGNGSREKKPMLRMRFSVWRDGLPADALPLEGWIDLHLLSEPELAALAYSK
jgi:alpha-amylase/alpha-mannosidase (GH57 family)